MKTDKELIRDAFAMIEEERAQFNETIETLMAGGLTREEEQEFKRRLEENEKERAETLEMMRVGVFEGTPFENSPLYGEIASLTPRIKPVNKTNIRRAVPWLVVAASILALCVVYVDFSQRSDRTQELRLARADLDAAYDICNYAPPTDKTGLLWYGFDIAGNSNGDHGMKALSKGLTDLPDVENDEDKDQDIKRVKQAFEAQFKLDRSEELRWEFAQFVLYKERDVRRAKDFLNATPSESPKKDALLGVAAFMEGEPELALEYFRNARKKEPQELEYALDEAICLTYLGREGDARPIFNEILKKTDDRRIKRDIQNLLEEQ